MKMYEFFRLGVGVIVACSVNGCSSSREAAGIKNDTLKRSEGDVAKEMFEQRCLSAGEKINKRVENVEGIYLLKLRPQELNFSDQYALDDPYGSDFTGEGYIESFLKGFYETNYLKPDHPIANAPAHLGYHYVDAIDVKEAQRYRYVGIVEQPGLMDPKFVKDYRRFVLTRALSKGPAPRYGVMYEDISTKEERDHWIAGSSLKVIDMKTNEILAERIGYMYDPGQGANSGGRSP
ncbi:hypothetical protein LXA47_06815, partial [Massilia sp. P8910]|nr:hypothetical protein [Massilia antarctica]